MIDDKIYRFDELIQETSPKPNLLLGNGFSIAFNEEFKYERLKQNSCLAKRINFEDNYEKEIENWIKDKRILIKIKEYITNALKLDLIYSISKVKCEPTEEDMNLPFKFLSQFENIFTLSYDALLYKIIVCNKKKKDFSDGFHYTTWGENKDKQNIFYLHGGLHLYIDSNKICKLKYNTEKMQRISEQCVNNIERNKIPIVIVEGKSVDKLLLIKSNSYLKFCYQKLGKISGTLFLHGHSLSENDKHIFDMIKKNNNIHTINISILKPYLKVENNILSDEAKEIIKKTKKYFGERIDRNIDNPLNINFYDASSAKIWDLYT